MICKNCLIWQSHIEDNKRQQLETIPGLARIGFTDKSVNELYRVLDTTFRELVSKMDNECPSGRCNIKEG